MIDIIHSYSITLIIIQLKTETKEMLLMGVFDWASSVT